MTDAERLAHVERWLRARVTVEDEVGEDLAALLAEYDRRGEVERRAC